MASSYDGASLRNLWTSQGGNPAYADMAASVALAESGGNPANPPSATNDWGLWQIHNGGTAMLDPIANVRRAISMSNNGQDWRDWCTAYSDAACGTEGGAYLGKGSPFLRYLTGSVLTPTAGAALSGATGTDPGVVATASSSDCLFSWKWPSAFGIGGGDACFHTSWGRALTGAAILVAGGAVMIVGLYMIAGRDLPSLPSATGGAISRNDQLEREYDAAQRAEERQEATRRRVAIREGLASVA
jgi:hypothetical protein